MEVLVMNLLTFDFGGTSVKYTLWQEDKLLDVSSFPTPDTWEGTKEKILEIKANMQQLTNYMAQLLAFLVVSIMKQVKF